jgi:uncharacterized RDD family membrane protein YckC
MPAVAEVPSARLLRRFASLCYEIPLLVATFFIAAWVLLPVTNRLPSFYARFLLQTVLVGVAGLYFLYCWCHGGQTLPMKTWRLRLVARDGQPLCFRLAVLRYLIALPATAVFGIGFFWAAVDRDGDFLHDRLAGTRIVMV